ncbi:MAG: hypothetical protein JOZ78_10150 [Chroococcidiopsidaceae cyanobacterium CP_BM_ER_R8_30]|nr:hypothetical protein [Chroococcidiopsidaceae cyanobacterium CP_BM_ER_R8_30]
MNRRQQEQRQSFQQLPLTQQQETLQQLKAAYRRIVLNYFATNNTLKQDIEEFTKTAFDTDVPTPVIIEIHIELIEDISKQLKLEGRSDDILLDYRLTLIDILAKLCELYRAAMTQS